MKELVIFYSRSGRTRALAQALAKERGADIAEVSTQKPLSLFGAFLQCPAAMRGAPAKNATPVTADFAAYDKITILGPIWANHPAPAVNNIIEALPGGTQVEMRMVSGGGQSNKEAVMARLEAQGAVVTDYMDVTGSAKA